MFALYLTDGSLVGVTNEDPIALPGVSIKLLDCTPNLDHCSWNRETLEFVNNRTNYSKLEFLTKFSIAERLAARSSADPIVEDFMQLVNLAENIDIQDHQTIAGIGYLVHVGILSQTRATEILNNASSP